MSLEFSPLVTDFSTTFWIHVSYSPLREVGFQLFLWPHFTPRGLCSARPDASLFEMFLERPGPLPI